MQNNKEAENTRIARAKAQGQRVFISSLQGHHSLEKGVAYHYRGHYVYSYPLGMPIDPVPFQTKQGINVKEKPLHSAPPYDPHAPGLVRESSLNALNKTWAQMWSDQKERKEEERKMEVALAIVEPDGVDDEDEGVKMPSGSKALSELPTMLYSMPLVPTQVSSRMGSRVGSRTDLPSLAVSTQPTIFEPKSSSRNELPSMAASLHRSSSRPGSSSTSFAAHDAHIMYSQSSSTSLAARDTNAGYTRSSSATIPSLGHSTSHPDLHVSSSSLTALGCEYANLHLQVPQPNTGTAPSMSSLSAYATSSVYGENITDPMARLRLAFYTPHDRARFLSDSAPSSRLGSATATPYTSRPVSPTHQDTRTLRQVASTTRLSQLLTEDLTPRASSPLSAVQGNTTCSATNNGRILTHTDFETEEASAVAASSEMSSPPYSRNKPIGTGRPRRASIALNQAHNAAKDARRPCVLHGEECDGVSTSETWKTRNAEQTAGFVEPVPVVQGAGDRVMVDWHSLLKEEQMRQWG
jgi:hypothetical protein